MDRPLYVCYDRRCVVGFPIKISNDPQPSAVPHAHYAPAEPPQVATPARQPLLLEQPIEPVFGDAQIPAFKPPSREADLQRLLKEEAIRRSRYWMIPGSDSRNAATSLQNGPNGYSADQRTPRARMSFEQSQSADANSTPRPRRDARDLSAEVLRWHSAVPSPANPERYPEPPQLYEDPLENGLRCVICGDEPFGPEHGGPGHAIYGTLGLSGNPTYGAYDQNQ